MQGACLLRTLDVRDVFAMYLVDNVVLFYSGLYQRIVRFTVNSRDHSFALFMRCEQHKVDTRGMVYNP
ncbi:hypothetical protein K470DRAFT_40985 [Piedraia hortae CBS 480.64]|uniref:Uncharacterized protein n=1 Tax=Piedraia hortae CBS 480.64 TaxID=1314780 RepID=A0A6A7C3R2_9PEZI|nr:hypothetical protein K470DRAFT_40985 [Piedraia hortae CBS 480.64]